MKKIILCFLISIALSEEVTVCSSSVGDDMTFICINDMLFLEKTKTDYSSHGYGVGVGLTYVSDKMCSCDNKSNKSKTNYNIEIKAVLEK